MGQFSNPSSKMDSERSEADRSELAICTKYEVIAVVHTEKTIINRELKFGTEIYGEIFERQFECERSETWRSELAI